MSTTGAISSIMKTGIGSRGPGGPKYPRSEAVVVGEMIEEEVVEIEGADVGEGAEGEDEGDGGRNYQRPFLFSWGEDDSGGG